MQQRNIKLKKIMRVFYKLILIIIFISCGDKKNVITEERLMGKWLLIDMKIENAKLSPDFIQDSKREFINNYYIILLDSNDVVLHIKEWTNFLKWRLDQKSLIMYKEEKVFKSYFIKKITDKRLIVRNYLSNNEYTEEVYKRLPFEFD